MGLVVEEAAWKMSGRRGVSPPSPPSPPPPPRTPSSPAAAPAAKMTLATTSPGTRSKMECGRWQVYMTRPSAYARKTEVNPAALPT